MPVWPRLRFAGEAQCKVWPAATPSEGDVMETVQQDGFVLPQRSSRPTAAPRPTSWSSKPAATSGWRPTAGQEAVQKKKNAAKIYKFAAAKFKTDRQIAATACRSSDTWRRDDSLAQAQ